MFSLPCALSRPRPRLSSPSHTPPRYRDQPAPLCDHSRFANVDTDPVVRDEMALLQKVVAFLSGVLCRWVVEDLRVFMDRYHQDQAATLATIFK